MRLLVFDDPTLPRAYQWLVDEADESLDRAMAALARHAYRLHGRRLESEQLPEQLRAHATVDGRPYVPAASALVRR